MILAHSKNVDNRFLPCRRNHPTHYILLPDVILPKFAPISKFMSALLIANGWLVWSSQRPDHGGLSGCGEESELY